MIPCKVPPSMVRCVWALASEALKKAVKMGGEYELEDIRRDCEAGQMQLWISGESAMITELRQFPRAKKAVCLVAGGDMADFQGTWAAFLEWAKEQGCDLVEICGRRGWIRALGLEEMTTGRIRL